MVNRAKKTFERNKQTHKEYNFRFDQPQLHSNPYQNQNHTSTGNIKHSKKPIVLDEGDHKRQTGKLKFFDEEQKFGFIIMDEDNTDIFVHMDDLLQANIGMDILNNKKNCK